MVYDFDLKSPQFGGRTWRRGLRGDTPAPEACSTDMNNMFNGCSSLTSLDLSHFDTSNVTDMDNHISGVKLYWAMQLVNDASFRSALAACSVGLKNHWAKVSKLFDTAKEVSIVLTKLVNGVSLAWLTPLFDIGSVWHVLCLVNFDILNYHF